EASRHGLSPKGCDARLLVGCGEHKSRRVDACRAASGRLRSRLACLNISYVIQELMAGTSTTTKVRLCVMMFLQYLVQGAYLPIVVVYLKDALGFDDGQRANFIAALGFGPLLAPVIVGQL